MSTQCKPAGQENGETWTQYNASKHTIDGIGGMVGVHVIKTIKKLFKVK